MSTGSDDTEIAELKRRLSDAGDVNVALRETAEAEIARLTREKQVYGDSIDSLASQLENAEAEIARLTHEQNVIANDAQLALERVVEKEAALADMRPVVEAAKEFMTSGIGKNGEGVPPFCTRSHEKLRAALARYASTKAQEGK